MPSTAHDNRLACASLGASSQLKLAGAAAGMDFLMKVQL